MAAPGPWRMARSYVACGCSLARGTVDSSGCVLQHVFFYLLPRAVSDSLSLTIWASGFDLQHAACSCAVARLPSWRCWLQLAPGAAVGVVVDESRDFFPVAALLPLLRQPGQSAGAPTRRALSLLQISVPSAGVGSTPGTYLPILIIIIIIFILRFALKHPVHLL